ncbi:MAG: hypothetical protein ACI8P3_001550 [Saprospiraceae bacterium]|jgi:hypothetical protein
MAQKTTTRKLETREDVITALQYASVLEHTLCCEYLFTGFSIRRSLSDYPEPVDEEQKRQFQSAIDQARPWQTQIYFIARQEMEHLAIATNLLAALGAPPFFKRPQFPVRKEMTLLSAPFCLERLSEIALKSFIWFERPTYLTESFPEGYLDRCKGQKKLVKSSGPTHKQVHEAFEKFGITSVEQLYNEIMTAFQEIDATELFQGDTQQQVGDVFGYKVYMKTITNRVEAVAAINLIIEQGEGIGLDPLTSDAHFQRFTQILSEYKTAIKEAPSGMPDPALPVLMNPLTEKHKEFRTFKKNDCFNCAPNLIERKHTRDLMVYFNECYNLMMLMLFDFFEYYVTPGPPASQQSNAQTAKYYAAFFPLMTMVIRPLGEILARIPAGEEYPGQNAGASFEIDNKKMDEWPDLTENKRLVEYYNWLGNLSEEAKQFSKESEQMVMTNGGQVVMSALEFQAKMDFLYENLHSTQIHLLNIWKEKYGE